MTSDISQYHINNKESSDKRSFGAISVKINHFKQFTNCKNNTTSHRYVYSDYVRIRDIPWRLRVDCTSHEKDGSFLEVFLYCLAEKTPMFECFVRATFTIIAAGSERSKDVCYKMFKKFDTQEMAWGCSNFRRVEELVKEENGFLHDGALHINAAIIVDEPYGMKSTTNDAMIQNYLNVLSRKYASDLKIMAEQIGNLEISVSNDRENAAIRDVEYRAKLKNFEDSERRYKDDYTTLMASMYNDCGDTREKNKTIMDKLQRRIELLEVKIDELYERFAELEISQKNKHDNESELVDSERESDDYAWREVSSSGLSEYSFVPVSYNEANHTKSEGSEKSSEFIWRNDSSSDRSEYSFVPVSYNESVVLDQEPSEKSHDFV